MAKLVIHEEFEDEETIIEDFELSAQRILIGSGPDNELVLEAVDVDPTHASLELRHEYWVLQDLGGPNGTEVNGQEIDGPYHLHHDDLIKLGDIKISFQEPEAEAQADLSDEDDLAEEVHISGRIWFAAIAGGTVAIIFIILFLLVVADYLEVLKITDLFPWLG